MIGDLLRNEPSGGVLARFTRDLTADARAGRLEPVRCREQEVSRVIDILLRHGKNNPTLVGPAGVGKTAIAEGLAQRIAAEAVPLVLRPVRLLSLDHVALLAGTTYRGQYEERIRSLVAETSAASDVILFIDELHNLIGQGTAMGVAMDAANMLKPALVRVTSLAPLEAELARQLMQEGIVIRGHDVARVVGLMAGFAVDWEAEETR
jgi:ATP-dependent Clp protease ATP-binding subunit ClpA